jgi:hypothetical protein
MHGCHVLIILPLLKKTRPRRRLYMKTILHNTTKNGVAEIKQTKISVRRNRTMFPIVYHVMSHNIGNISGHIVIERHEIFVIIILQKISTNKGHNRNSQFIARKLSTKNHRERPTMLPFLRKITTRGTCECLYEGYPLIDHNLAHQQENSDLNKCKPDVPYIVSCCYICQ